MCVYIGGLTLVLLWLPAVQSIVRHSAGKEKENVLFSSRCSSQHRYWYMLKRQTLTYTHSELKIFLKRCRVLVLSHLLWEPVRRTTWLWERLYGSTYRHPGRQRERFLREESLDMLRESQNKYEIWIQKYTGRETKQTRYCINKKIHVTLPHHLSKGRHSDPFVFV